LSIKQANIVIFICRLVSFDPYLKPVLRFRIHLLLNNDAAHQGGEGGVPEHHGAIAQALLAPLH